MIYINLAIIIYFWLAFTLYNYLIIFIFVSHNKIILFKFDQNDSEIEDIQVGWKVLKKCYNG